MEFQRCTTDAVQGDGFVMQPREVGFTMTNREPIYKLLPPPVEKSECALGAIHLDYVPVDLGRNGVSNTFVRPIEWAIRQMEMRTLNEHWYYATAEPPRSFQHGSSLRMYQQDGKAILNYRKVKIEDGKEVVVESGANLCKQYCQEIRPREAKKQVAARYHIQREMRDTKEVPLILKIGDKRELLEMVRNTRDHRVNQGYRVSNIKAGELTAGGARHIQKTYAALQEEIRLLKEGPGDPDAQPKLPDLNAPTVKTAEQKAEDELLAKVRRLLGA